MRRKKIVKKEIIVSRVVTTDEGKAYLEVGGHPILYNAVQAWKSSTGEFLMKNYAATMIKAQEVGYRIFTFWLSWRDIEPHRGTYNWQSLKAMIEQADKLDMHLDIVWGGSNFCAHLDPRFAPDWLLDWEDVHLKDSSGESIPCASDDYGHCPGLNHANRPALEAEKEVLHRMVQYLAEYDKHHRVIFIQILNEPNMRDWTHQGKETILPYANELAGVIKNSDYQIATRMNLQGKSMEPAIEALEHIDCHGTDPYDPDIEVIRNLINTPTKMPYIAENAAYENTTSLMLTAFANGGGYNVYMLGPCLVWEKPGIYGLNWVPREITCGVYNLNSAVNRINHLIAKTSKSDMIEFNTETTYPQRNYEQIKMLAGYEIGMKTWGQNETRNGAVGLALYSDAYFYLIADRITWFLFRKVPDSVSSGQFDQSGQWVENTRGFWDQTAKGVQIPYHAGECLRVKLKT